MCNNIKPIIGIIGRPDMASDDDKVICIWEETRRAIVKKGGIPLLILPPQDIEYETTKPKDAPKLTSDEKDSIKKLVDMCDGLLIPGGYKWYEFDEFTYSYALNLNMPILGICLGMQLMCCFDTKKNNIVNDTTVKNETHINHHQRDVKYVHKVNIEDNTKLKNIVGEKSISVNSKHNYHAPKTKNLIICAYSEDGLIEAVEYDNKDFVIGVQWHPETMLDYDQYANKIFDKFIEKSTTYSNLKNNS